MSTNQIDQNTQPITYQKYVFPKGLPGFEDLHEFQLQKYNEVFSLLKSAEVPTVAFITVNPFDFFPDYEFQLSDEILEELEITEEAHVAVGCIVTWSSSNHAKSTVNLLAPLIFNTHLFSGKQVVLQNTNYTIRHPLWPVSKADETEGDS